MGGFGQRCSLVGVVVMLAHVGLDARARRYLAREQENGTLIFEPAVIRDWAAHADTHAEDGELAINPTIAHRGRAGLADFVSASLSGYPGGTHHLSTNHAIALDGDEARTRS